MRRGLDQLGPVRVTTTTVNRPHACGVSNQVPDTNFPEGGQP